jgi:hypothetical protein
MSIMPITFLGGAGGHGGIGDSLYSVGKITVLSPIRTDHEDCSGLFTADELVFGHRILR